MTIDLDHVILGKLASMGPNDFGEILSEARVQSLELHEFQKGLTQELAGLNPAAIRWNVEDGVRNLVVARIVALAIQGLIQPYEMINDYALAFELTDKGVAAFQGGE